MVATTKVQHLFRKTYPRGLVLFFYGLLWLVATLAAFIELDPLLSAGSSLIVATWAAALAGGLGGATGMLSRLSRHVSTEQDIHKQSVLSYLIQPFIGLVAGILVLYLVSIPIGLAINFVISRELLFTEILASSSFTAIQMVLAWLAGFYQRRGLDKIRSFTRQSSPTPVAAEPSAVGGLDEDDPLFFKAWSRHQKQMIRWSYSWGVFLFIYAIAWMIGFLALFLATEGTVASMENRGYTAVTSLILAAWPAAAAAGLGGACSLLYDLYRHVSLEQDFHRQYLMSYLVQPIVGFVFGLVVYLLLASGYLVITTERGSTGVVDSSAVIMLQLLLGWIAGFRQQYVTDWTQQLIQHLVSVIKSILAALHPRNWFNKANRDEALSQLGQEGDLFRLPQPEEATASDRKWWQFD
jgi:uncharacterized membrane protein